MIFVYFKHVIFHYFLKLNISEHILFSVNHLHILYTIKR